VRNEGVRDYFVAMTRVFRCGDLEVKGFTDGSLKTSLDFVLGMERATSRSWSAEQMMARFSFR
jgi:hypothetical protein